MESKQTGVLEHELGIVQKNGIYFYSASSFAQQHLFYPLWGATYTCAPPYCVERQEGFDAFLLFYIINGEMQFHYDNKSFIAGPDSVVLLNSNQYNMYFVNQLTSFHWFHFNGAASMAYCSRINKASAPLFIDQHPLYHYFTAILRMMEQGHAYDDLLSVRIHQLLCLLAAPTVQDRSLSQSIEQAKQMIDEQFRENLSIEKLAACAMMSPYHFSRVFRSEVGIPPHAYLTQVRLDYAKLQLIETTHSIETIAADCAFCSASNFIRTFRKHTGVTPFRFRKLF